VQQVLLVVLIILAYLPVWRAGFVWDDDTHLTANPCVVGPLGLKEIWTTSSANYFPLVLTTFWLEHALWGLAPLPYHLVNIAFHAGTALLLISVLRRLGVRAPWWGAALWALHPVQTESVAWVSELTNMQSGFFFVLAIALYVEAREVSRGRLLAVAGCALAAMLSKPSTVMLPVVLLLCRWWSDGTWSWRQALRLAPLFAVAALVSGWTIWEQRYHSLALGPEWRLDTITRTAIASRDVWFYLRKLVFPYPLSFVYPRWTVPQAIVDLWPALLAASGYALLWRYRAGALRPAFFAATYFLLLLFPMLGWFDVYYFRYSFVADHFQYLAAIGPLAGAAAGLDYLLARVSARANRIRPVYVGGAALVIAATMTFAHARVFSDSPTLWRATLATNPNCWIAETVVGNLDERAGRSADATRHHQHASELDPFAGEPHYNLGISYFSLGRYDDAIAEYQRGLALKPNDPDLEHNLGVALGAVGRQADAVSHYERALHLRPNYAPTELMLALALTLSNRADEALPHYEAAIRVQPGNFKAQYSYARTLEILGRLDDAIPHFRAAIKAQPNAADAHGHLGAALVKLGDRDNGADELQCAAELDPTNLAWRDALAALNK
jgi:tetratricopeptide (TPR) repeat protein